MTPDELYKDLTSQPSQPLGNVEGGGGGHQWAAPVLETPSPDEPSADETINVTLRLQDALAMVLGPLGYTVAVLRGMAPPDASPLTARQAMAEAIAEVRPDLAPYATREAMSLSILPAVKMPWPPLPDYVLECGQLGVAHDETLGDAWAKIGDGVAPWKALTRLPTLSPITSVLHSEVAGLAKRVHELECRLHELEAKPS